MGLPITTYTDTDAIRGAVGVTNNEITDAMLTEQGLSIELTVDLDGWLPTHAAIQAAGEAATPTAAELGQWRYLQLYAQWFCAAHLLNFMQLAVPQMIGDGKAEMRRFQDVDLEALASKAMGAALKYKSSLQSALGETIASVRPTFLSRSVPDYDPVAGV